MSASDIQCIVMALQKDNHDHGARYTGPKVHTMDVYDFVRAVLRAIREPTEEMARIGIKELYMCADPYDGPAIDPDCSASECFTAMIDHLLED